MNTVFPCRLQAVAELVDHAQPFSDSWTETLLSGTVGALIGAAAAVISAILVARRSYADQRSIAAEGRARKAAAEFLTVLRRVPGVTSQGAATEVNRDLDAAATLWFIEEEKTPDSVRILTRAVLHVLSDAWDIDVQGIESLFVKESPSTDMAQLYTSAHTAILELLEGKGDDAVHHFLISFGLPPDGAQFLE